jgi:hypothetical protein
MPISTKASGSLARRDESSSSGGDAKYLGAQCYDGDNNNGNAALKLQKLHQRCALQKQKRKCGAEILKLTWANSF